MSDFKGITQDTLFLMQLNRFNDSKAFYEENKEKIKANMTVPMRQIAASLSDMMLDIDPFMNTIPTKMVSRVRRDTRYTHDKHLYRENMWIMFMRPKKEWHMYPCMWFEVTLRNDPEGFKKAVKSALSTGAMLDAECYKRPKPDCPAGLENFYNAKYLYFVFASDELSDIGNDGIITRLEGIYKKFAPMYRFLRDVSDDYFKTHQ